MIKPSLFVRTKAHDFDLGIAPRQLFQIPTIGNITQELEFIIVKLSGNEFEAAD
jgi:hypothetical protein